MNPFSQLLSLMLSLWWLPCVCIVFGYLGSPAGKGAAWEFFVNLMTKVSLNGKDYVLLKNVTLPTDDGTTQVDHIIVSKYGVFVVEAKNYGGWIFGDEHQKMWTQKLPRSQNRFQNPLHQNYKHTRTVAELTGLPHNKIHSVVAFSGNAIFKTEMPDQVTTGIGYLEYVKSKKQVLLSAYDVARVVRVLERVRHAPSRATNKMHVENVNANLAAKLSDQRTRHHEAAAETPSGGRHCTRCSAKMVIRSRTKAPENGQSKFYGCSNYPRCRNTAELDG